MGIRMVLWAQHRGPAVACTVLLAPKQAGLAHGDAVRSQWRCGQSHGDIVGRPSVCVCQSCGHVCGAG